LLRLHRAALFELRHVQIFSKAHPHMNRRERRANATLGGPSNDPCIIELLKAGVEHHQAGRSSEADACYRDVLALQPNNAEALHLLGVLAHQRGRSDVAVELFRRALRQEKQNAVYLGNLAVALREQRAFDEAATVCRNAIRLKADFAEAHCTLGAVLRDQGKLADSISASRLAIRYKADLADAHSNLGAALHDQGKLDDAVAAHLEAIRLRPDMALFHFNLGATLHDCRRYDEAVNEYRQAIRINPDFAEAHSNLGATLREQDKLDEAIAAERHALRIKPDLAVAHSNLGAALYDQGHIHDAVAAYRQAILLKPDLAAAHGSFGAALIELGRVAEGRASLQRAINLAPRKIKYRRYLGEVDRYIAGEPRLAALEEFARNTAQLSANDRIELHFALGKAYDDVARYADAFRHLLEGNALKRRQIVYNEAATLGVLERIRTVFTSDLIRAWRNAGHPSSVPIFVVGMQRSGTTLVEQILASHPQVFGAGELKHFDRAMEGARAKRGRSAIFPEAILGMTNTDFYELGAQYAASTRQLAPGASHIVDKMPANFLVAGLIHLALPNAVIIHAKRDPMDTCLSCFSKLFAETQNHTYDLAELGRYYRGYQKLMEHWRSVLPAERILDVRYEDVVADLEGQARRIIAHCGLDWDPQCLAFYETKRPVRTASAMQVRQPIYNSAIGRWRLYESFLGPLRAELAT
jgi:tetratricopeptide (TPR) repeat protein